MMHQLHTDLPRPTVFNNPFCYEPDPLCLLAAEQVKAHIHALEEWREEVEAGKMFGVLVCEDSKGELGFLAAYSGQIGGREDWPWFVPAVFDYLQSDGYFKREEAEITAINQRIASLDSSSDFVSAKATLANLQNEAYAEIEAYKSMMREAKVRRHEAANHSVLIKESQFQKAELRRIKKRWQERLVEAEEKLKDYEKQIVELKKERKHRSDALQRWLFDQFRMLNRRGEGRTLTDIFKDTPQQLPPSGSGECCAPKLLQYAFQHNLRPLCMAEFWQGRSPKMEVRHHDHYYPACRGKCKPILEWMLSKAYESHETNEAHSPQVLFSDNELLVINKPAGLLSVPGKCDAPSVENILLEKFGKVFIVHRLDMDTSGLMVVARTEEAYHHLQRQFLARTIYKRYIAMLDGIVEGRGTISLPLRPDLNDRPRQLVDYEYGKTTITDYEVIATENGRTRIALTPHTGRTHQLRVHCAHQEGLATPIIGDNLYGTSADRLYLHAETLSFDHPKTNERLTFQQPPEF